MEMVSMTYMFTGHFIYGSKTPQFLVQSVCARVGKCVGVCVCVGELCMSVSVCTMHECVCVCVWGKCVGVCVRANSAGVCVCVCVGSICTGVCAGDLCVCVCV